MFILSSIPVLDKFSKAAITVNKKYFEQEFLVLVISILEELIFFVLDIEKGDKDKDALSVDGFPPQRKQRLLKDMKLIELLTDILYYPFKNKMFLLAKNRDARRIEEISKSPLVMKIFRLSYRLIKHIIREYRPNELYASQWIELFMSHAIFCDKENYLFAEPTLTELIDNNQRILESRIKRETISRFMDMLVI